MTTAPGSWPSPITLEHATSSGRTLEAVAFAGDEAWWSEGRPLEDGRIVVCRRTVGGVEDLTPAGSNARTRVHEYGGTSWLPVPTADGVLLAYVEFTDQRLYLLRPGAAAEPLTPQPAIRSALRYADLQVDPVRRRLLAVRETHEGDGTFGSVRRTVVAIPLDGSGADNPEAVIDLLAGTGARTHDFVAGPRLSSAADQLVWFGWDHPDMPWDSTRVHLAALDRSGAIVGDLRKVASGSGISAVDAGFTSDGSVLLIGDDSGWWRPTLLDARSGRTRLLSEAEADFADPLWVLGRRSWARLPGGRFLVTPGGIPAILDSFDESVTPIDESWTRTGDLDTRTDGTIALVVGGPTLSTQVVVIDPDGRRRVLRTSIDDMPPPAYRPVPVHREIDGVHVHLYPPTSPDHVAAPGTSPLLVTVHGGPTSAHSTAFSMEVAFFTSRGFTVAGIDHRGSTGYGRAYRDALRGGWAEVDLQDVITATRALQAEGTVGGAVIAGGSAGGLTVLGCLTTEGHPFAGGASRYGIGDLAALAEHTHDFESRYLDGIVGTDPQVWQDRSPLLRADRLATPVLLLQGGRDPIVTLDQAEAFAQACRDRGVPHALIVFPDEGHGFRAAAARREALAAELSFYGQVLGFPTPDVPTITLVR